MIYFSMPIYLPNVRLISEVFYSIILVGVFILPIPYRNNIFRKQFRALKVFCGYFGIYIAIVGVSATYNGNLNDFSNHIPFAIVNYLTLGLVIIYGIKEEKSFDKMLLYICFLNMMLSVIIGFIQMVIGQRLFDAPYFDIRRLSTLTIYDPNYAALEFIILWVLNFHLVQRKQSGLKKIILGIGLAGFTISILMTYSRAAWITLLLIPFQLIFLYGYYRKLNAKSLLLATVFMIIITTTAIYCGISEYVLYDERFHDNRNIIMRMLIWKEASGIIESNYLFGVGTAYYEDKLWFFSGFYMTAHNLILHTMLQRGVVGIIFLILLVLYIYRLLFSLRAVSREKDKWLFSMANAFIIALTSYLIMVQSVADSIGTYLWFFLACALVMKNFQRDRIGT